MKTWFRRLLKYLVSTKAHTIEPKKSAKEQDIVLSGYSSDQPIRSITEDRFNRGPFAARIADTIAARRDPSCIVIGLYAPWGDGKSSTLNLMEQAFSSHSHIVLVRFNPWNFQSEENLLRGFFATLAKTIGKSLPTTGEKIGNALTEYGWLLSLASPSVVGVSIKLDDAAESLGKNLSAVGLDDLKSRLETLLAESGKRVVVLIDDIDRLDRTETQCIFKLVKLSASFDYTSYVLSFDDEMVAAAIGERYAQGGAEAGRSYLEKIIQVPLHLPPPNAESLYQLVFEGVEIALAEAKIEITNEQAEEFTNSFIAGLGNRLETPRHAKLYLNAITFALPLLKGEVNLVDLLLIEGIRAFLPKLYAEIRDNRDLFLSREVSMDREISKERLRQVTDLVATATVGLTDDHRRKLQKRLVEKLFPRTSSVEYGHDWERQWSKEQHICSENYFDRFFNYSVPPSDVSDVEIADLLAAFKDKLAPDQDEYLKSFSARKAYPRLIEKLRERESLFDQPSAQALACALARNGMLAPRERGPMVWTGTWGQTGILISRLLEQVPAGDQREVLALKIIEIAQPLPFALECQRWFQRDDEKPDELQIVSSMGDENVRNALAKRIKEAAASTALFRDYGSDSPGLYRAWHQEKPDEASADLRTHLSADLDSTDVFLDNYVRYAWSLDTGLSRRGDFRREAYDSIDRIIDASFIAHNLRQKYGVELDAPQYHVEDTATVARRIAHQFMFIHKSAQADKSPGATVPATNG